MKGTTLRTMIFIAFPLFPGSGPLSAQDAYQSSADFLKYAEKLRETAILQMEPQVAIPSALRMLNVSGRYQWKNRIVTTTFWIGSPSKGKSSNVSSAWDSNWMQSYGGYDNPNPESRRNYVPIGFIPRQNPFYFALPYNDVAHGAMKPEAKVVIPWFKEVFVDEGKSVCRDRWVAIRNASGKVCYAQWGDCGPFRSDHWQYVFGNEKPKPNANQGAGLNVSPAVRDFLGLDSTDVTDWKFVEARDVPTGPWALYGDNNHFVERARSTQDRVVSAVAPRPKPAAPLPAQEGPTIIQQKPE